MRLLILFVVFQLYGCKSEDFDDRKRLLVNDPHFLQSQIDSLKQELQTQVESLKQKINSFEKENQKLRLENSNRGTYFTIWGKNSCPGANGTDTIYTGITGGNPYDEKGNGVNYLCLPHHPDSVPNFPFTHIGGLSHLHGSEYEFTLKNIAQDDDVPCAVCQVNDASLSLMIPAKTSCPSSWTLRYSGLLCSSYYDHVSQSDYVCIDSDPEYATDGARQQNYDGKLLYPVQTKCGSLPCPPYKDGQYVPCVVCTK